MFKGTTKIFRTSALYFRNLRKWFMFIFKSVSFFFFNPKRTLYIFQLPFTQLLAGPWFESMLQKSTCIFIRNKQYLDQGQYFLLHLYFFVSLGCFIVQENERFIAQAGSRHSAERLCALTSLYISAKDIPLLTYSTSAALILLLDTSPVPRLSDLY